MATTKILTLAPQDRERRAALRMTGRLRRFTLLFLDLALVCAATLTSLILRENFEIRLHRFIDFLPYLLVTISLACVVFLGFGLHRMVWRFSSRPDFLRIIAATAAVVTGAASLTFAYNRLDGVARSLPVLQFLLCSVFLIGARVLHKMSYDARQHRKVSIAFAQHLNASPVTTVLIVGISKLTEAYLQAMAELAPSRFQIGGLVGHSGRHVGRLVATHPILGVPEEIENVLDRLEVHGVNIDRIVVASPFSALSAAEREALLRVERSRSISLQFLAEALELDGEGPHSSGKQTAAERKSVRAAQLSFEISPLELQRIAQRRYWVAKRAIDCFLALALLVVGSPFIVIAALAAGASVGFPVIFWQQRPGFAGRPFRLYKFRTMRSAHASDGRRLSDEERVSPIGRLMRRLRIDELPQLFNIVRGDMGFVGPRPVLASEQSTAHRARLLVRPGLTGWAQVVGGRNISPEDKAALDVWYVRNASFTLDLEILLRTMPMVLLGERVSRPLIERAWSDLSKGGILKGSPAYKIASSIQPHSLPV